MQDSTMRRLLSRGILSFLALVIFGLALALTSRERASAQKPAVEGRRIALLIGVNKYDKRGFRDLEYAQRDVEELAAFLREADYETHLLTGSASGDKRATLANIQKAVETVLKGRTKKDLILVALAGHGLQIEVPGPDGKLQSESFFCPADAEQGEPKSMFSIGRLFAELDRRGGGQNLVLVDACREDPTRGRGMDGSTVKTLPEGVAVLFGCRAGQKTYETKNAGGGHGVFFHFVLEGLRGEAKNARGDVTWGRLVEFVSERVSDEAPRILSNESIQQTPNVIANLPGRSPVLIADIRDVRRVPLERTVVLTNIARQPDAHLHVRLGGGGAAKVEKLTNRSSQRATVSLPLDISYFSGDTRLGDNGWLRITEADAALLEFDVWQESTRTRWTYRAYDRLLQWNSLDMKLVPIRPGVFQMGSRESPQEVADAFDEKAAMFEDEHPRHQVRITKAFYLSACEVTLGQFRAFVRATGHVTDAEKDGQGGTSFNPNAGKTNDDDTPGRSWKDHGFKQYSEDRPVVMVSRNDAVAFCRWLSQKEKAMYRLPTEAEWEYACRAGTSTRYWFGNDPEGLITAANSPDRTFLEDYQRTPNAKKLNYATLQGSDGHAQPAPVGSFRSNPFGLYDMHGNVWEWCLDRYDPAIYSSADNTDPIGRGREERYVIRGGCYM
jgi:sulfatase modifying factor 1